MSCHAKLLIISSIGCGPPFHGNRVRLQVLLSEIKKLNIETHFAGINLSEQEKRATIPYVDTWAWDFYSYNRPRLWSRIHDGFCNFNSKTCSIALDLENADSLDRWIEHRWLDQAIKLYKREKYDAVLVEYVFNSAFLECFGPGCLRILDTHDVFGERAQRLAGHGIKDMWFSTTINGEKFGLNRADRIIAIQQNEAQYFNNLIGESKPIFTIGHIITPEYLPLPNDSRLRLGYLASDNPVNVKSFGWFFSNVWQPVCKSIGDVDLIIGGRICLSLAPSIAIKLLGEFTSVRDFYLQTHITINPMITGTGLKIKTIESLAYGRASIATSVATEGLEDFLNKNCGIFLANSPDEFIIHIKALQNDIRLKEISGRNGIQTIKELNAIWRAQLHSAFEMIL